MDNTLIYTSTKEEHDRRPKGVLKILKKHRVTLNLEKCEFSMNTVRFLIINGSRIKSNPKLSGGCIILKMSLSLGRS